MTKDVFISPDGMRTEVTWESDGNAVLKHTQDSRFYEKDIVMRREAYENRNRKAKGRWVANIPKAIYWDWVNQWKTKYCNDWDWNTYLAMKLNSSDYSKLRSERI